MILGSPLWLLLSLLGLLILLLHVRRRRTVEISSVYLWRRLAGASRSQSSWKLPTFNLLLLLQLLVLCFIALALARPWWGEATGSSHVIYILDASGSMQARDVMPSRFAAAKDHILQDVKGLGEESRASVIAATSQPYVAAARLAAVDHLKSALERVSGSHAPGDWNEVAALLRSLLLENETARVVLVSDGAQDDEAYKVLSAALPDTAIEVVRFVAEGINIGLAGVTIEPLDLASGHWQLAGQVVHFGAEAITVPLSVHFEPEGSQGALEWAKVELELEESGMTPFNLEVTLPGPGVVELRLPEDGLMHDNHAFFVIGGMPKTVRVLHVGPENRPLQRALLAIPDIEFFRADALPTESSHYDLVILDRVMVSRHPETNTLWLVADPTLQDNSLPLLADPYPSGWHADHPLSQSVDWSSLSVSRARQLPRLSGAEVLVEASGYPLVQARTGGYGREVAIAFGLHETDWAEHLGFPAFLANLVRWVEPALGSAVAPMCRAGEPCPLDPRLIAGEWQLIGPDGAVVLLPRAFVLEDAAQQRAGMWLARSFESMFMPEQAGLYVLEADGQRHFLAVNAFYSQESDIRPAEIDDAIGVIAEPSGGVSLWPWLLALTLIALLLEGAVAGLKVERFLRPAALSRRNVLAGRHRLILVLHGLAAIFLVLALLQIPWFSPVREGHVIFVADQPHLYSGRAGTAIENFLEAARREVSGSRQGGLIWVGSRSQLGDDLGPQLKIKPPETEAAANLQSALSMAAGMLPDGAGRIVLVSDGSETRGRATDILPQLLARNVPIDVYPVGGIPAGEVMVEQVAVHRRIHEGDTFLLKGIIYSERETPATVRIWRNGELWGTEDVHLLAGRTRIEMMTMEEEAETYLYELEVEAQGDVFAQNNRDGVAVKVHPAPKIAIFTSQEAWGEVLAEALQVQGLSAEVLAPDHAPHYLGRENLRMAGWMEHDVAILMNVPAIELRSVQQEHLEAWVREKGGGLIVLGGENTFGPGGYYRTALEDMLPLSTNIPHDKPSVAINFVLDRSGSMRQPVGEVTRLDVAKHATLGAVELLDEESLVGIVVFDSQAEVLVPMQRAGDYEQLKARLEPLEPGGGTSIYPGLVLGFEQLLQVDENLIRHIVVMTDGLSQQGDFEWILEQITAAGITVSTAAIGQGADVRLVELIARLGGGVAYVTADFQAFPSILAQEALLLADDPIKEETFVPVWEHREIAFLQGLPDSLPPLHGYVQATAKPEARVHLYGPEEVPLLASWRYGLGRVVAFASHGVGPWAAEWLAMPEYPLLWAQAVRWALPATPGPGLNLQLESSRDVIKISVEAVDPGGELEAGLALEAEVIMPAGEHILELRETESGRYEGWLIAEQAGSYHIRVRALDGNEIPNSTVEGSIHLGYPARYAFDPQGAERLTALAHATGGRVLLGGEPIFAEAAPIRWVSRPAWPLWAVIGLAFFLAGLLLRYLPGMMTFGVRLLPPAVSRPKAKKLVS